MKKRSQDDQQLIEEARRQAQLTADTGLQVVTGTDLQEPIRQEPKMADACGHPDTPPFTEEQLEDMIE